MALRSGYKGYKKLAEGLKEFWPGILGADIPALKKTFLDWSSYAVTGVHNYFDPSAYLDGTGVTVTNNGKSINITAGSADTWVNRTWKIAVEPDKDYVLTSAVDITTGGGNISVRTSTASADQIASSGQITEDGNATVTFNSGNHDVLYIVLFAALGTSVVPNVTYNDLLLRLASDTNTAWTPYAMTNRELTEKKVDKSAILLNASNDLNDIKNENQVGYYRWESAYPVNSPENKTWSIMQMLYYGGGVKQIVYYGADTIYIRQYVGGTWSSWYKFAGTEVS